MLDLLTVIGAMFVFVVVAAELLSRTILYPGKRDAKRELKKLAADTSLTVEERMNAIEALGKL